MSFQNLRIRLFARLKKTGIRNVTLRITFETKTKRIVDF